ncbi:MAG: family 78 glycoside hydrolase catalytic domain, partial [Victivallales bacterium]|nr:family 78 glycoside hydrolase catalytic domain [Victivallales bacterium]
MTQSARQIRVVTADGECVWDSGWVMSGESLQIPYEGAPLRPFTRYCWSVRVKDGEGRSTSWSGDGNWFETGFLGEPWAHSSWIRMHARWFGTGMPPAIFSREFTLPRKKVVSARLYATALGCYEAEINGQPVTQDLFTPGWTAYHQRVQYQAYDVTHLLRRGGNTLMFTLANGWYAGRIAQISDYSKYLPKLRCELHLRHGDGSVTCIGSDGEFRNPCFGGPVQMSDIYDGETIEAWRNREWLAKETPWRQALTAESDVEITWNSGAPVRRLQLRSPEKITRRSNGNYIVDFGQNLTGRERLTLRNTTKGETIVVTHAEMLRKDGTLYLDSLRTAKALSTYVCDDADECVFEPRFTFYGFRYIEISGIRGKLSPKDISAVVLSSDLPRTGLFSCSSPLLNKLFENIGWGMRSNFLDVPTDCPQRDERLGWTGDTQVFCNTATYNIHAPEFYTKWLEDLNLDLKRCGCYPDISPMPMGVSRTRLRPCSGWSDAGIVVPWMLYRKYNDTRILARHFDGMMAYIRLCVMDIVDGKVSEGYLCRFADWLNQNDPTDPGYVAHAYLAGMMDIMIQVAGILKKRSSLKWLKENAVRVRRVFTGKFVEPGKGLKERSQCAMLMALHWNLLPAKYVKSTVRELEHSIRVTHNLHLSTGFLGTPLLLPVLSRCGLHELAGELLMQTTLPGWLYPVTQGATTMWERWDSYSHEKGFGNVTMNSFNHYAYGAVAEWFYEYLGGIREPENGYKHFTLAPQPIAQLDYAEVTFCSPYGPISS